MANRILFVCLGNICRSPAAEGVFRSLMPEISTDSAGLSGWHAGEPPYAGMQDAARRRGIDISDLRSRQFTGDDFTAFDLILGMDADNIAGMQALRPTGNQTPLRLFTHYAPHLEADHIPDPYYTRDFGRALDLIEHCAAGLQSALQPGCTD